MAVDTVTRAIANAGPRSALHKAIEIINDLVAIVNELQEEHAAILVDLAAIRAPLAGVLTGSATYDAASLADGAGATTTVTVTGAALGDYVLISHSVDLAAISVTGYVSASNTVSVRFQNESTGAVDLASGTLRALVLGRASFAAPGALTAAALTASSASDTISFRSGGAP
jgi:hypothetical protein